VHDFVGLHEHEPFANPDGQLIAPSLPRLDGLDDPLEVGG
jgi:hypothetical protein